MEAAGVGCWRPELTSIFTAAVQTSAFPFTPNYHMEERLPHQCVFHPMQEL